MTKHLRVWLHSELQHVVQNSDGVIANSLERPAMCGKSPWPERWERANDITPATVQLCVTCLRAVRNA